MNEQSEDLLLEYLLQTALGNRVSFKMLYDRSAPVLLTVIKRIVVDLEIAEDVLQETFIKVWYQAQSYRVDKSKPMTWMISIARNCAIDNLRKNKHQNQTSSIDENLFEQIEEIAHAEPEAGVGHSRLLACMEKLEPQQRQAILASYCEGYSHRELSESFQTPIGTVKSWLRRSLISLKRCLVR